MRKRGKVDIDQAETVRQLRRIGASVQVLSGVGAGCPDLAVGYHGRNILLELKTGSSRLTKGEQSWHAKWGGQVAVVRSPEEAMRAVVEVGLQ